MVEKDLIDYIDEKLEDVSAVSEVEKWINDSDENRKEAEQLYYLMRASKSIEVMEKVDNKKAFVKFQKEIQNRSKSIAFRKILRSVERVAAILLIPLVVSLAYLINKNANVEIPFIEISSKPGMVTEVDLPDGSHVWLNSSSTLKYPLAFNGNSRNVELLGQAYFDVEKNEKQPFIVSTIHNYSVEVLGTEFDIAAYEDDRFLETVLVKGSVKINIEDQFTHFSRVIHPNDKISYDYAEGKMHISKVNALNETAWKDGRLIFKDTEMSKVLKVLSRYYNVDFRVLDNKILKSSITGKFDNDQLPQIMEYLKIASGIDYKINKPIMDGNNSLNRSIIEIK